VAPADSHVVNIKRIVQNVIALPTLPTVVAKLIELVDDPRTSASTLGKLISTDQVLTVKILKLANSAFYGFPRKIGTVDLAIVVLGFDMVRDFGLSVSVIDKFGNPRSEVELDYSRFWEHSIGCGVACKMLARTRLYRLAGEAFVAGLLHDIGKLVLNQYLPREFKEVRQLVREGGLLFYEAEARLLNTTHAQMGGWLAEKWNLPESLVEALTHHHTPQQANNHGELTALVNFADILCRRAGVGFAGDDRVPPLDPLAAEILPLKRGEDGEILYDTYVEQLRSELERAETFINLIKHRQD